ncbi:hypothetical protein GXW83_24840 [Streptacidiphilus sp. PB12-B1b]|uniref:hypothetical protein n=1 Tax=Streptacidiphilus sp. PB12-B1b TaxID=2705012 RepID=UPI0015FB9E2D|nr:hypothetical protein [Streptacidiphilus sp. PB12-B1b]QMU78455.1 hypothetical protein GXW83_24840 [Streptacidiphilus sp. PB12-B1b]
MANTRDAAPRSPRAPRALAARTLAALRDVRALRARRVARVRTGWIAVALGAGLCFLGWYGVSGERYTARQLPYLASATAPGVALLLGGTILLGNGDGDARSLQQERILRQLELLYRLLTEAAAADAPREPTAERPQAGSAATETAKTTTAAAGAVLFAVPGGGTYHLAECLLLQGRDDPQPAAPGTIVQRALRPCPLCEPPSAPEG